MDLSGAVPLDREAVFREIGYSPHPKQLLFHDSEARFKVAASGRRFGKSKMAAAEALTNKRWNLFMENIRGWIVGPKYKTGEYEFRYLWDYLKKLGVLYHKKTKKAYNVRTGEMFIELPWGARVDVMSAQHKDSLVGEGLHFVIMSEAAKHDSDVFDQYIGGCLTDYRGWAAFPSTPEGFNWYWDLFRMGMRDDNGDPVAGADEEFESWNFPSWDNPYIYPGGREDPEIIKIEKRTPVDVFWQEYGASFRSAVGLVYPEFDEDKHVIEHYTYRPEWPNYLAIDFGFTNPFVCLDIQVSPSDDVYVWRERYVSKVPIPEHIREIQARPNPEGYKIDAIVADFADPGGIELLNQYLGYVMADPETKDFTRGITEIKRFLIGEDDQPHLFISRPGCPMTIKEFLNYRMKKAANVDQNAREQAQPWMNHALDCLRYWFMQIFVLGAGRYSLEDVYDVEYANSRDDGGFFTRSSESAFSLERNW